LNSSGDFSCRFSCLITFSGRSFTPSPFPSFLPKLVCVFPFFCGGTLALAIPPTIVVLGAFLHFSLQAPLFLILPPYVFFAFFRFSFHSPPIVFDPKWAPWAFSLVALVEKNSFLALAATSFPLFIPRKLLPDAPSSAARNDSLPHGFPKPNVLFLCTRL